MSDLLSHILCHSHGDISLKAVGKVGYKTVCYVILNSSAVPGDTCVGILIKLQGDNRECCEREGLEGGGEILNVNIIALKSFTIDLSKGGNQCAVDKVLAGHYDRKEEADNRLTESGRKLAVKIYVPRHGKKS